MTQDFDIVVAGGGLNGPTLALALAQAGLRVAVVDPRPARARSGAGFDGRAYSLAIASVRVLRALGLWDRLAPDAQLGLWWLMTRPATTTARTPETCTASPSR